MEGLAKISYTGIYRTQDNGRPSILVSHHRNSAGAIVGYALEQKAETIFRTPLLIAIALIVMGAILFWAERKSSKKDDLNNITLRTSLLIGLSQALAIIPGVSRSGITITAGLFSGLSNRSSGAVVFAFHLKALIPYLSHMSHPHREIYRRFLIGTVVAVIAGIASIGFLLAHCSQKLLNLCV